MLCRRCNHHILFESERSVFRLYSVHFNAFTLHATNYNKITNNCVLFSSFVHKKNQIKAFGYIALAIDRMLPPRAHSYITASIINVFKWRSMVQLNACVTYFSFAGIFSVNKYIWPLKCGAMITSHILSVQLMPFLNIMSPLMQIGIS